MRALEFFVRLINNVNDRMGNIFSWITIPIILILTSEVFMRYVFNRPTIWAHETSEFLYGALIMLGGAYALRWSAHVNVDIFYVRFSPRLRAIIDLLTWMLFYLFIGVFLWRTGEAAWNAVGRMEHSYSFWGPPTWPIKLTMPIAGCLMILQGLTKTIGDIYTAITGHELVTRIAEKEVL